MERNPQPLTDQTATCQLLARHRPERKIEMPLEDTVTEANVESDANAHTPDHDVGNASLLFDDGSLLGLDTHTPIIITDGSASIEFAESEYIPDTDNPNRRRSQGLHLVKITANQPHPAENPESLGRDCVELIAGKVYEVEITCARDGQAPNKFLVGGGPTVSPVIQFDHRPGEEYRKDPNVFRPIQLGQRYGNVLRNITRMQVFTVDGNRTLVHECRLAARDGIEYVFLDIH